MNREELYHFGIPGMRWGVRRSLEELGRKRKQKKAQKKRAKALKRARKARVKALKAKKDFEKNKEKYAKDPTLMNKHKEYFTTEEINKANQRFMAEQNLHNASISKLNRPKSYVETATGYMNTAMNAYDAVQRVSKVFNADTPLPPVDSRSKKEAQKFLKSIESTPLNEIDRKEVEQTKNLLKNMKSLESYAKGKKDKDN